MIKLTFSSPSYCSEVEIDDDKHLDRVLALWLHLKGMIKGIIKN